MTFLPKFLLSFLVLGLYIVLFFPFCKCLASPASVICSLRFLLVSTVGVLGSLSLDQWEIRAQPSVSFTQDCSHLQIFVWMAVYNGSCCQFFCLPQPSSSSRFYVLHDWEHAYSQDENTTPLPVVEISDIMLKTMGILKVWSTEKDDVTLYQD